MSDTHHSDRHEPGTTAPDAGATPPELPVSSSTIGNRAWFAAGSVAEVSRPPTPGTVRLGVEESLDPRVVPYWLLSSTAGTLFLAVLATGGFLVFGEKLPGDRNAWAIGLGSLLVLLLVWGFVQAPLAYRRWRYTVDESLLSARYGVIVHEAKIIPISRMQHVDLIRGPFERMFGLTTLIVFTAGTDNSSFRVPGLRPEQADGLRDHILATRGDDVV